MGNINECVDLQLHGDVALITMDSEAGVKPSA